MFSQGVGAGNLKSRERPEGVRLPEVRALPERRVVWFQNELVPHEGGAGPEHDGRLVLLVVEEIVRGAPQGIQPAGEDGLPLVEDLQGGVEEGGEGHELWGWGWAVRRER